MFKCILKYQITYHIYLHLSCNYEYVKLLYKKKLHVQSYTTTASHINWYDMPIPDH